MKKNLIRLLGFMCVLAIVFSMFAGCGADESAAPVSSAPVETSEAAAEAPADDFRALVPILEADEDDPRLEPFHVLPSFDQDEEIIILAPGNIAFAGDIVRMEAYQANRKEVGIKGLYMCGATVQRPDLIWRVPLTVERRIP